MMAEKGSDQIFVFDLYRLILCWYTTLYCVIEWQLLRQALVLFQYNYSTYLLCVLNAICWPLFSRIYSKHSVNHRGLYDSNTNELKCVPICVPHILHPFLFSFSHCVLQVKAGHSLKKQQCTATAISHLQMKANTSYCMAFRKHQPCWQKINFTQKDNLKRYFVIVLFSNQSKQWLYSQITNSNSLSTSHISKEFVTVKMSFLPCSLYPLYPP